MNEETQITIPDKSVQLGALRADSPTNVVDVATLVANKLTHVVESKHLFANIQGKKFPTCEAWTTCAAMLGISAKERAVRITEDGDYEAEVDLIDGNGMIVGGASAVCGSDEKTWATRPRYARRSMAVTRATSKACRLKLSWIMTLAGYQPCPAEEVSEEGFGHPVNSKPEIKPFSAFQAARKAMKETAVDAEPQTWRDACIHFGKNKGVPLGELNSKQLDWYANDWVMKKQEDSRQPSAEDVALINALLEYKRGLATLESHEAAREEEQTVPF